MKEFSAQTGGRYTYVDDIVNLQDLSLAFASIFSDCDNFIISGCEISGTSISEGYVYINGKIRRFNGVSGITAWPQFIYESNKTETVAYASGSDKVGRNVYGCSIASSVPTTIDSLTGRIPGSIRLESNGGLGINDALFGKYSLLLQSKAGAQEVNDRVTFKNGVTVGGAVMSKNITLTSDTGSAFQAMYVGNELVITSNNNGGHSYKFVASNAGNVIAYINNEPILIISGDKLTSQVPIQTPECTAGNISVKGNNIFNKYDGSSNAGISINMMGFGEGYDYYRDLTIGNGKGKAIVSIKGSDDSVGLAGSLSIANNVFLTNTSSIIWKQGSRDILSVGYDALNRTYAIKSTSSNLTIQGLAYVDIYPAIKEGGVLLSEKYITNNKFNDALNKKADKEEIYTRTYIDSTFANVNKGFSQFIEHNAVEQLRSSIGAASEEFVTKKCAQNDKLLSDMATDNDKKKAIRDNINAQEQLYDSGWLSISTQLFARQIGRMVSIQGKLSPKHSGEMFEIPRGIDIPKYSVSFSTFTSKGDPWACNIQGQSRTCRVTYCDGACDEEVCFSMIYMV